MQSPKEGTFAIHDLQWQRHGTGRNTALVASIPKARLDDFLKGEEDVGKCEVKVRCKGKQKDENQPVRVVAECIFAGPRNKSEITRQNMPTSDEPPSADGKKGRRCAHQTGLSCKMGCTYHFSIASYADHPDAVIIRFPAAANDTIGTCLAMQHHTEDGLKHHDHPKCQHHLKKHQIDIDCFVVELLEADMKAAAIKTSVVYSCVSLPHCDCGSMKPHSDALLDIQVFNKGSSRL